MGREKIGLIATFTQMGYRCAHSPLYNLQLQPSRASQGIKRVSESRMASQTAQLAFVCGAAWLDDPPRVCSILVSDVDTVWMANPLPFMANYPQADCLTSSDHVVPPPPSPPSLSPHVSVHMGPSWLSYVIQITQQPLKNAAVALAYDRYSRCQIFYCLS